MIILAIFLWLAKAVTLAVMDLLTWITSPITCLFVTKAEENSVTGMPSLFPGKPREFLIKPLRWLQSFDAPLDEWWYGNDYGKGGYFKKTFSQDYYDNHWWLRYCCRILWLCRNPSYGLGHRFGYDTTGLSYQVYDSQDELWNTGVSNHSYFRCTNHRNQIGFWYKRQWFYTTGRCVHINLGYKLDADSPDSKKVVAMQFNPFLKIKHD